MTLQQLRYADAVAACGSVSEAARRVFVTQPTLTEAIRSLEEELRIAIFTRSAKGVSVTREGEEFLASARQMLDDAVAKWLQKHPNVGWVKYPSLTQPELAAKYLPNGAGGVVVFGVKGGSEEARKVTDAANGDIFSILANVGDAKSLIIHPASTTHSQLSDEDLRKGGVLPELIRLSIGLEHIDDIIDALDEAFKRAFPNG